MTKILIINGPNLNMLGKREPEIYGSGTLADVEQLCRENSGDLEVDFFQSNYEGAMIDIIQSALDSHQGIIINAGAYTHTSIAIHDALKLFKGVIIEVHISDIKNREEFRHHSYIAPLAHEQIIGQGIDGYRQAIEKIEKLIHS